jgi:hypothetical protein
MFWATYLLFLDKKNSPSVPGLQNKKVKSTHLLHGVLARHAFPGLCVCLEHLLPCI